MNTPSVILKTAPPKKNRADENPPTPNTKKALSSKALQGALEAVEKMRSSGHPA